MAGYGSKQVNVGSLINPTEGISRSLNDLSAMYGRQADAKANRDILARNEKTRADAAVLAQSNLEEARGLATKRFNVGQENIKAAALESKSRFGLGQDRLVTKDKKEADRQKFLSDFSSKYNYGSAVDAALKGDDDLRNTIDGQTLANAKGHARNTLMDLGVDANGLVTRENIFGGGRKVGTKLSEKDLPKDPIKLLNRLLDSNTITKDEFATYTTGASDLKKQTDDYISRMPVFRENERSRIANAVMAGGGNLVDAKAMSEMLSGQYLSKEQLEQKATNRQQAETKYNEKRGGMLYKIHQLQENRSKASGKSSKSPITTNDIIDHVNNNLEDRDSSFNSNDELVGFWEKAIKTKGVTPYGAKLALGNSIEEGSWADKTVKGTYDDYLKNALEMSKVERGTKYSEADLIKKFTGKQGKNVDLVQQEMDVFLKGIPGLVKNTRPVLARIADPKKVAVTDIGRGNTGTTPAIIPRSSLNTTPLLISAEQKILANEYAAQADKGRNIGGGQASRMFASTDDKGRVTYNATPIVLKQDDKGNIRPWQEQVRDANGRNQINKRINGISNKEASEAENNPEMQARLLNRTNAEIMTTLRAGNTLERIGGGVSLLAGSALGSTSDFLGNLVFGEDEYSSSSNAKNGSKVTDEEKLNQGNAISRSLLDEYTAGPGGTSGGSVSGNVFHSIKDVLDYGLNTNSGNVASALVGVGSAKQLLKFLTPVKNAAKRFKSLTKVADKAKDSLKKAENSKFKPGKQGRVEKAQEASKKANTDKSEAYSKFRQEGNKTKSKVDKTKTKTDNPVSVGTKKQQGPTRESARTKREEVLSDKRSKAQEDAFSYAQHEGRVKNTTPKRLGDRPGVTQRGQNIKSWAEHNVKTYAEAPYWSKFKVKHGG
jgi:hypothetical protein